MSHIIRHIIRHKNRVCQLFLNVCVINSDSWEPEKNLDCKDLIDKFTDKLDRLKNVSQKELREVRPKTQRFTLMTQADARRLSKRNVGRQR